MNRKEKYYNFIVDDLLKKTEIDYEKEEISFPSSFLSSSPFSFSSLLLYPSHPYLFSKYLKDLYGTRDEEVRTIWKLYKERIQSLIDNG